MEILVVHLVTCICMIGLASTSQNVTYNMHQTPQTWNDAKCICQYWNQSLLFYKLSDEDTVKGIVFHPDVWTSFPFSTLAAVWTGGFDKDTSSGNGREEYVWYPDESDASSVIPLRNRERTQKCVSLSLAEWIKEDCNTLLPFVCLELCTDTACPEVVVYGDDVYPHVDINTLPTVDVACDLSAFATDTSSSSSSSSASLLTTLSPSTISTFTSSTFASSTSLLSSLPSTVSPDGSLSSTALVSSIILTVESETALSTEAASDVILATVSDVIPTAVVTSTLTPRWPSSTDTSSASAITSSPLELSSAMPSLTSQESSMTSQGSSMTSEESSMTSQESSMTSQESSMTSQESSTTPVRSSGSQAASPKSLCQCRCKSNQTKASSVQLTKKIVKELTVDARTTSASKRRKESVPDERVSAQAVGAFGIAILGVVFGAMMAMDLPRAIAWGKNACRNFRPPSDHVPH